MRWAALISGGKDSICALTYATAKHRVECLVNIQAIEDSYMFHVPCAPLSRLVSQAVGIPLVSGVSSSHSDELTLLHDLLHGLNIDGLVAGTIESNYQMNRLKALCDELSLQLCAPLWGKGTEGLLRVMARSMDIVIVQVAAYGMDESWLGRKLDSTAVDALVELNKRYGVHIMGEGGEYETLVLDAS
ncbi:MAG: diphthine--ammonia ligase, partial [Euryarchaeota archaeon]|nr:diphthine--ammonia ligase [Euryarchaeota archaeon]